MEERLQKYMASCGVASRRESEKMILDGRVAVNGMPVFELGFKVNPDIDRVSVDGTIIKKEEEFMVVLLNKPAGYISSASDERGRKTVMDLVHNIPLRLYPVGRLDADTEGLILLTNDGELSYRLTHPRFGVTKTYRVILHGKVSPATVQDWESGILLEDGKTSPAKVDLIYARDDLSEMLITIHEGKNRQIRRMARATGHHVYCLERIMYSFLTLDEVPRGQYRLLTATEIANLRSQVNLS